VTGVPGVVTWQAFTATPSGVFSTQISEGLPLLPDDAAVARPLAGVVGLPGTVTWQAFTAMPSVVFMTHIDEGLALLLDDAGAVRPLADVDVVPANAAPPAPSMMARPPTTTAVLPRFRDKGSSFPSAQTDCVMVNTPGGYSAGRDRYISLRPVSIKSDRPYRQRQEISIS
jgi:hypothetical protein